MKKLILLFCITSLSINCFSQEVGEQIKSLNRKCREVKNFVESKYNKTIKTHECDVSLHYGSTLESYMSFDDTPLCKSKVIAHFNKNYKGIVQVKERMEYEKTIHLKTEKLKALASKYLTRFSGLTINYTQFELSIQMRGEMNKENQLLLENFLAEFTKAENKQFLMEKMDSSAEEIRIPQFYLHVSSNNLDTSAYSLKEFEENAYLQSKIQIENKFNSKSELLVEYNITVDSRHIIEENGIKYLQRRLTAINPSNEYKISNGGYNYVNEL